jgi:hypothetical protein
MGHFVLFTAIFLGLGWDWHRNKKAPDQPIAFSHRIHVGKVGLECQFCHQTTDKSTFAGIPSVQKCMSCHANVATDRPEIQKLTGFWDRQEPMEWNRVHRIRIRENVFFSHKRHINAEIQCEQCHGQVKYMDKLRRVSSLEMGWCVGCHQQNNASTDCLTCHR